MTKINRLVMQGFKSFAKKTELVFEEKFNCILGPNGSGKSNVLDALCFVLGKSSSKSLRAEKSANLIYNGGKKKNPAPHAIVELVLDNTTKEFPIDTDTVKISRKVRQDGTSRYRINGKNKTRQQVVELLQSARINPDGYNIILQGDITRLIEMSPNERREIVEEIAGISIYEEKKQKALNELNKVEERLKEAEIIMAERHTYLRELKKERNEALKFKELNDKIKQNKATVLHVKIKQRESKKEELENQISKCQEKLKAIEEEISRLKREVEEKKDEIRKINNEIEEKGDKDQVKIQKAVEQLRVEIATDRTRISSCENEVSRVASRKEQLSRNLEDIKEKIDRLIIEKTQLEKSIDNNKEQGNKIQLKIKELKERYNVDGADNIEKEVEEIDKLAEAKQLEIQQLRENQQNLFREKDRLEYQIEGTDERIDKIREVEKQNQKELERLKEIKQDFKKATLDLNIKLNQDSSLAAQLGTARDKLLKVKEEIAKLNAKQASVREKISGGIAVQKILALKSKMKGIYGTVAELGHVPSRYSLALEVSAGPRISSIVVESDKVAADCIKYLKQNKLGVATFLPLDKIKPILIKPEVRKLSKSNGAHGLAVELVKFDPRFSRVFSHVFGNTIVVENIDTARRIGVGKVRMASLDGDLIEFSGAMQGGFRKRTSGLGFQEKEVTQELKDLENRQHDLEKVISNLEKKKLENEEDIAHLRELKANLEAEIIKIQKSLHLESEDLEVSKGLKNGLREKLKEIETKLSETQKKITICNKELTDAKIKKQQLRQKINTLKNPALLAELNTFEQKHSELKEEILRLEGDSKNIKVQIGTILKPEQDNIQKILRQHEKEEEQFVKEISELKKKIMGQESELSEKEKTQKEFYTKFKGLFKKRDGINENISKLENIIYQKEDFRRKEEQRMNSLSLDNAKVSAEFAGLMEEYKEYEGVQIFKDKDEELIKKEIWQFEKMVSDLGAVNMRALEIYGAVEKEYGEIIQKKDKLTKEREDVLIMMNEIDTKKKTLFMKTFESLNNNFKSIFTQLSTKGEAFLELEEPETIFEGGLRLKVRISGKKFLDIRSLSGGEKTLTALAFLFAVQEFEPAHFYMLDEVDAALDKRNSERLASLIRKYTNKAQYIVISHNDGIISEADNLYGVSMDEHGISKLVSLEI